MKEDRILEEGRISKEVYRRILKEGRKGGGKEGRKEGWKETKEGRQRR